MTFTIFVNHTEKTHSLRIRTEKNCLPFGGIDFDFLAQLFRMCVKQLQASFDTDNWRISITVYSFHSEKSLSDWWSYMTVVSGRWSLLLLYLRRNLFLRAAHSSLRCLLGNSAQRREFGRLKCKSAVTLCSVPVRYEITLCDVLFVTDTLDILGIRTRLDLKRQTSFAGQVKSWREDIFLRAFCFWPR